MYGICGHETDRYWKEELWRPFVKDHERFVLVRNVTQGQRDTSKIEYDYWFEPTGLGHLFFRFYVPLKERKVWHSLTVAGSSSCAVLEITEMTCSNIRREPLSVQRKVVDEYTFILDNLIGFARGHVIDGVPDTMGHVDRPTTIVCRARRVGYEYQHMLLTRLLGFDYIEMRGSHGDYGLCFYFRKAYNWEHTEMPLSVEYEALASSIKNFSPETEAREA